MGSRAEEVKGDGDGIPLSDSLRARREREVWKAEARRGCLGRIERAWKRLIMYDILRAVYCNESVCRGLV